MLKLQCIEKTVTNEEVRTTFGLLSTEELIIRGTIIITTGTDNFVPGKIYNMYLEEIEG